MQVIEVIQMLARFSNWRSGVSILGAIVLLAGCKDAKQRVVRAIAEQAIKEMTFDKEFRIIDGEAVFVDSDMGGGKVLRKVSDADVASFQSLHQPQTSVCIWHETTASFRWSTQSRALSS